MGAKDGSSLHKANVANPRDTFQHMGIATKKPKELRLRQMAVKGGQFVHEHGEERFQIGNDWFRSFPNRAGYDENFLGEQVALPSLTGANKGKAAPRLDDPKRTELEYTHFSIVQNKERRMPFFTAVNIDGSKINEVERKGKWLFDARISVDHQMGNVAYKKNDLDRGHMVRRRDPVWGKDGERASGDTFVYTNAALQHVQLNQHEWLDLENRVLDKAQAEGKKMTVFTGPVFNENDPSFDNNGRMKKATKMPQEFWKVVVWKDKEKGLQSEAFVMSQRKDLAGNSGPEDDPKTEAEFQMYRVPLDQLEKMTQLDFGNLNKSQQTA